MEEVFVNQFNLPGLFFDSLGAGALSGIEASRGIVLDVDIPATDKVAFSNFVQEMYKVAGIYTFSERGIMRVARLGFFSGDEPEDFRFDDGTVITGKTKKTRPLLWQKTSVTVPGPTGQLNRIMSDEFEEGEAIINTFREKAISSEGLGGKIKHQTDQSAIECMNDILGWRGFPRHEIATEVDILGIINRAVVEAAPLFSIGIVEWETGCAKGIMIEKKLKANTAALRFLTIEDPKQRHPGLVIHPVVRNEEGSVIIKSHARFVLEGFLEGDSPQEFITGQNLPAIILDNAAQRPFYYKITSEDPECSSPDRLHRVDSDLTGCFIMGVSLMGQPTCI